MRLLVCGDRHLEDRKWVAAHLGPVFLTHPDLVIGCGYDPNDKRDQGADQRAYEWAKENGVPGRCYPAHWHDLDAPGAIVVKPKWGQAYNRRAGPDRNQRMWDSFAPDRVMAFAGDPMGPGTAHMCKVARVGGIEPEIIYPKAKADDGRCAYDHGWSGRCERPRGEGLWCLEHAINVCDGCGAQATHACTGWMGSIGCGTPLCDNCDAINNHEGGVWPMKAKHGPKVKEAET